MTINDPLCTEPGPDVVLTSWTSCISSHSPPQAWAHVCQAPGISCPHWLSECSLSSCSLVTCQGIHCIHLTSGVLTFYFKVTSQTFPSLLPIDPFHVSENVDQLDPLGWATSEPSLMLVYLDYSFFFVLTILTVFKTWPKCPFMIFLNNISLLQLLSFMIIINIFFFFDHQATLFEVLCL